MKTGLFWALLGTLVSWDHKDVKHGKGEKSYSALTNPRDLIPDSVITAVFHNHLLCGNHYNKVIWLPQERLTENHI